MSSSHSHLRPPRSTSTDPHRKKIKKFVSPLLSQSQHQPLASGSGATPRVSPLIKDSATRGREGTPAVVGGRGESCAPEGYGVDEIWSVMWRLPQHKKNKTWDCDGALVIKGGQAILRDDDGKIIGRGIVPGPILPSFEFKLGGKEVQIQDIMTYEIYFGRYGADPTPLPSTYTPAPTVFRPPPPRKPLPPATTPLAPAKSSVQPFAARPPAPYVSVSKESISRNNSSNKVADNENAAPKGLKKRQRIEDSDEEGLGKEAGKDDTDDIVMSPRASQRRGIGLVPTDLSNRAESVDGMILGEDAMDVEKDRAEERRREKGKGKEVEVFKLPSVTPRVTLLPVKMGVEVEEQSHYYLCQWRNFSTKKNPSWEGDGVLIITGKKAILKDKESGKEIGTSAATGAQFSEGDPVTVGRKTCEIESILDERNYMDGSVFLKQSLAIPKTISSISASSFFQPVVKTSFQDYTNPLYGGKGGKGKAPKTLHDPKAEGAIVMSRPSKDHELRFNLKGLSVVDVVIDPKIGAHLREHQIEGVKFMYECVMGMKTEGQGCILADEMGLGKTIQAIALIWTLLRQNPYYGSGPVIERAVIVCPVTLLKNWSSEIKKWLGPHRVNVIICTDDKALRSFVISKSFQVLIVGYERLRKVVDDLKACQPPIGLVICDEGHRLKSANGKVVKALRMLSTPRRVILSGTPIQNELSEFHSMVDFVNPGALDTYSVFKKVFETVILKSREPKANSRDRSIGSARQEQLSRVSKMYILRRSAEVIKEYLPPKIEFIIFIIPTNLQVALYKKILEGAAVRAVLSGVGAQQLSLLMILRSLSNTPGLLLKQIQEGKSPDILTDSVASLFPPDAQPNDFSLSGKFLVIGSLLEELWKRGEEKIVVVSNFTSTLDIIHAHCTSKKYPICRLDGSTAQAERVPMVDNFNKSPRKHKFIFLLSSKSGGTGLNIIGASRLILVDSDWNPSSDAQAMARIHREGQQKPCFIYRFLTSGTMDEKIFQRQVTKLGLSTSLMDGEEGAMGAGGKGDAFTGDDLRSIFKLHDDTACQTHDLLGCRCHLDSNEMGDSADEDEEEELSQEMMLGFTQASQMPQATPNKEIKDRKNLSLLKQWVHHDCADETAVDELQDAVLREVAFLRVAEAPEEESSLDVSATHGIPLKGGNIGFAFSKKSG